MEPYARAMLQLLYCAAGGAEAEVFTFATRLTRLTGALAQSAPEQALRRAGQAAPDWLGGTRIGASLKEFNDTVGPPRAGPGRGGGDHFRRLGHRRPGRAAARDAAALAGRAPDHLGQPANARAEQYRPLAGGMAAAWPYCDAVVSAHSLNALDELTVALARPGRHRPRTRDGTRRGPELSRPRGAAGRDG